MKHDTTTKNSTQVYPQGHINTKPEGVQRKFSFIYFILFLAPVNEIFLPRKLIELFENAIVTNKLNQYGVTYNRQIGHRRKFLRTKMSYLKLIMDLVQLIFLKTIQEALG